MTAHDQHRAPKTDIEIAQAAKMRPIVDVAADKLDIPAEDLIPYGHYKAKVSLDYIASLAERPDGKLILVTAITPTPAGEGKTTTTVGLGDALNEIGKKAMICIREPSLGFALSRLTQQTCGATPIGIFRQVEAPVYDDLMSSQIDDAVEQRGEGDLEALLHAGETWVVA